MKTYSDAHVPQPHPTRPGWVCVSTSDGGFIGWQNGFKPNINANHIDGPLLTFSDGQMHWLTIWERILFAIGLTDAEKLEQKRRPNLVKGRAEQRYPFLYRN